MGMTKDPDNIDEEMPEEFDLSSEVDLSGLSVEQLLFRESIVKAFYETVVRTGNPVWGFSKVDLESQYKDIVEEFKTRGRNYLVSLDRSNSIDEDKKIVRNKQCAIEKSKSKEFSRFITDPEVRLRHYDFETGKCEYCNYFSNMRCTVLEHIVSPEQVCDAYSGSYFYDNDDRKYVIENFNRFIRGLVDNNILKNTVIRSLDSPAGLLIIFRDNMKPEPHYFSVTIGEFIEQTVNKHHWTQREVDDISGSGGGINEL